MIIYLLIMAIFLIMSAFFSGMEAAIFSISRFRVKTLLFENRKGATTLEKIKRDSGKTLASILLANLLVNIAASSVGAIILIEIITTHNLNSTVSFITEFIIMTSLLLIIGEITPKTVAISNAEFFALKFGKIIDFVSHIFSPMSALMEQVSRRIIARQAGAGRRLISDKEIKLMLSEAKRFKVLDEGEEKFGYQIVKFGTMKVYEIMTQRQKVTGIAIDASIDDARRVITSSKHSRICVFDPGGNVVGILYAKDLYLKGTDVTQGAGRTIRDLTREPYIVPESKQIDNLLKEFRKNGIHMSVVVDEFGNFSGIVTLEDILESLFGEIIDEHDELADLPYEKVSPTQCFFEGDITIGEITRILNVEPFEKESERLAAFILSYFGKIPKEKTSFQVANLKITIEEIHDRIIEKVLITKLSA
jgi:CBS domain containing-hemolysin-like protein